MQSKIVYDASINILLRYSIKNIIFWSQPYYINILSHKDI